MRRNIRLYEKEIERVNADLDSIERKGECCGFKFKFSQRNELRDFAESIYHSTPDGKLWRDVYKGRISSLKRLLATCEGIRHRNEQQNMDAEIEIFRSIKVSSVLQSYNIPMKHTFANCPLHGEKTPSLCVYETTNSWYCFGCHKGGNSIDLVMGIEKKPFKDIVPILRSLV
jgi:hypothetical protein